MGAGAVPQLRRGQTCRHDRVLSLTARVLQQRDVRARLHGILVARGDVEAVGVVVMQHAFLDRELRFHVGIAAH